MAVFKAIGKSKLKTQDFRRKSGLARTVLAVLRRRMETMQLREEQPGEGTSAEVIVQLDAPEQLSVTCITEVEVYEFFELWSLIKPIGPGVNIEIKQGTQTACSLTVAGTELGSKGSGSAHYKKYSSAKQHWQAHQ
jgi:hypothetical protein